MTEYNQGARVRISPLEFQSDLELLGGDLNALGVEWSTLTLQVLTGDIPESAVKGLMERVRIVRCLASRQFAEGDPVTLTGQGKDKLTNSPNFPLQVRVQIDRRAPRENAIILHNDGQMEFVPPAI